MPPPQPPRLLSKFSNRTYAVRVQTEFVPDNGKWDICPDLYLVWNQPCTSCQEQAFSPVGAGAYCSRPCLLSYNYLTSASEQEGQSGIDRGTSQRTGCTRSSLRQLELPLCTQILRKAQYLGTKNKTSRAVATDSCFSVVQMLSLNGHRGTCVKCHAFRCMTMWLEEPYGHAKDMGTSAQTYLGVQFRRLAARRGKNRIAIQPWV